MSVIVLAIVLLSMAAQSLIKLEIMNIADLFMTTSRYGEMFFRSGSSLSHVCEDKGILPDEH